MKSYLGIAKDKNLTVSLDINRTGGEHFLLQSVYSKCTNVQAHFSQKRFVYAMEIKVI